MANYNCLKCGKPVDDAAPKCGSCGSDAAAMKVELEKRENERLMQEIFATDRQEEAAARARRAAQAPPPPPAEEPVAARTAGAGPRRAPQAARSGAMSANEEINKFRKDAGLVADPAAEESKFPFLAPGVLIKGTLTIAMLVWSIGFSGRPFAESALTLGVVTFAIAAIAVTVDFVRYSARAKSA